MARAPSLKSLVDEVGRLQAKLAPLQKLKKECAEAEAQLVQALDLKPNEETLVQGHRFAGTVSAQGFERAIVDKPGLIKLLGDERYMDESKILLGRVDELVKEGTLTAEDLKEIIETSQTGPRKVKILKKAA